MKIEFFKPFLLLLGSMLWTSMLSAQLKIAPPLDKSAASIKSDEKCIMKVTDSLSRIRAVKMYSNDRMPGSKSWNENRYVLPPGTKKANLPSSEKISIDGPALKVDD